jgi:hypothetical protein
MKNLPKRNKRTLQDLLDCSSICALRQLGVDTEFLLNTDPVEWKGADEYENCRQRLLTLKVVNDGAERGIALVSELNTKMLTRDECEFQRLIQVIEDNRQRFPEMSKSSLIHE